MEKLEMLELRFPRRRVHPLVVRGTLPQNIKEWGNVVVAKWTWWGYGSPYTPLEIAFEYTGRDESILEWMDIYESVVFAEKIPNSSWYYIKKIKVSYVPLKDSHYWRDHINYYAQVLGIK